MIHYLGTFGKLSERVSNINLNLISFFRSGKGGSMDS